MQAYTETGTATKSRLAFAFMNWRHGAALTMLALSLILHVWVIGKYAWWNVAGSVPPMLLMLVPVMAAMLAIRAKRKGVFFLYAALLLLIWFPRMDVNLAAPVNAWKSTDAAGLKVLSWNTEFWDQYDQIDMYAFLRDQDQDIYILSEYEYNDNWQPLLIDRYDEIVANFPGYHVVTEYEFVIISKYPVMHYELGASKQVMMARVQVEDKELVIVNVHLRPHVDLGNSLISPIFWNYVKERHALRLQGFEEIRRYVEQEQAYPVIVTGDLNTTVLMTDLDEMTGSLNHAIRHSTDLFPTSWARPGGRFWWRIDHFFYNDHVEVHTYDMIHDVRLSDHKAMVVNLELK
ncbi:hypothetical protein DUZ99_15525 [Xylanibacillus composti]|uniref:Endonuclease/exonuclease/phosphatase domain-containing protein n=1 Tax=Xylanibacillus composti TaxID=1572762 RepID=A0A8J4H3L1_9BACL|nr:endonuclease/exonuclease/phosphatase family protein [Xylanibacillus composti]MDT9726393.1 hypothetical protein [Xylanibacillus composti]GIQ70367.1 hypothetical protein XYCOK13_31910 [Xylanibacillus composti]